MQRRFINIFLSLSVFLFIALLVGIPFQYVQAEPASPQDFVPLTNLPGLTDEAGKRTLADYLNVLFRISIGIGALAAVIQITIAGIKYMASDAFSSKEEAKKDITGALFGLLIMLSTVVILQLIYPNILNLNVLQKLAPLEIKPSTEKLPEGTSRVPPEEIEKRCTDKPPCELKPGETVSEAIQLTATPDRSLIDLIVEIGPRFTKGCGGRIVIRHVFSEEGCRFRCTQVAQQMFCIDKAPQ